MIVLFAVSNANYRHSYIPSPCLTTNFLSFLTKDWRGFSGFFALEDGVLDVIEVGAICDPAA